MCFASTRCATVEPGKSWDLTPFCGRSTCVVAKDQSSRWVSSRSSSHRRSFSYHKHSRPQTPGIGRGLRPIADRQRPLQAWHRSNKQDRSVPILLSQVHLWARRSTRISRCQNRSTTNRQELNESILQSMYIHTFFSIVFFFLPQIVLLMLENNVFNKENWRKKKQSKRRLLYRELRHVFYHLLNKLLLLVQLLPISIILLCSLRHSTGVVLFTTPACQSRSKNSSPERKRWQFKLR